VRQREVTRLAALALALTLAAPVAVDARRLLLAGAFLVEFLADGRAAPLTRLTAAPVRVSLTRVGVAADRHLGRRLIAGRPLVLVHGFAPAGKDDPRVMRSAELLARAGFDVTVPSVSGLMSGRLRPADVDAAVAAVASAPAGSVRLVGVSVGAGPALIAAADPRVRDRVGTVVALGGYASAVELLRFFLTGEYAYGPERGRVEHDREVVRAFIAANGDLVDEPTRRALLAGDARRAAAFLDALPPDLGRLLDALSPERVARDIRARLVLVHGRGDPTVPYTESLRLAAARPEGTTVILVRAVGHLEGPGGLVVWRRFRDLLALGGVVYRLLAGD
jgi:pimeloyl-ACP methyl ester carboxylesterase